MPKDNYEPSRLLINEVDKLTYRQLQLELKARQLKAAGKTEVLRERLRKFLINHNEEESIPDYHEECSICLDKLSNDNITTVLTTCLHRYHRICLKKWIESNGEYSLSCPLCRYSLANDRYIEQNGDKKFVLQ
jgi:hypothetical protein